MSRTTSFWECQQCGFQSPKWAGRCPECQSWGSLVETAVSTKQGQGTRAKGRGKEKAGAKSQKLSDVLAQSNYSNHRISTGVGELDRVLGNGLVPGAVVLLAGEPGMGKSTLLSQVSLEIGVKSKIKNPFGLAQGGQKSKMEEQSVLYVCGEESPSQVGLRLQRLLQAQTHPERPRGFRGGAEGSREKGGQDSIGRLDDLQNDNISLFPETDVDLIVEEIEQLAQKTQNTRKARESEKSERQISRSSSGIRALRHSDVSGSPSFQSVPNSLVIIDSIQTLTTLDLTSIAGSVSQVRECAGRLSEVAKRLNIPLFLVGHVNKEGEIAGPKVLEHLVDVVLMIEGDRSGTLRILRAVKNRFGPVDEVGLFAMEDGGMREVVNPAELLIGEHAGRASGSVLGCVLEGQRPLVLEVQALTVPSKLSVPRRVGQGVNERRLQLLCAVVERHLGLGVGEKDVFVNVAGGLTSADPGLDLAVVAAIVSSASPSFRAKPRNLASRASDINIASLDPSTSRRLVAQAVRGSEEPSGSRRDDRKPVIFCGEVGLLGEVRNVQGWERREKEVKRLGLGQLVGKPTTKHIRQLPDILR